MFELLIYLLLPYTDNVGIAILTTIIIIFAAIVGAILLVANIVKFCRTCNLWMFEQYSKHVKRGHVHKRYLKHPHVRDFMNANIGKVYGTDEERYAKLIEKLDPNYFMIFVDYCDVALTVYKWRFMRYPLYVSSIAVVIAFPTVAVLSTTSTLLVLLIKGTYTLATKSNIPLSNSLDADRAMNVPRAYHDGTFDRNSKNALDIVYLPAHITCFKEYK